MYSALENLCGCVALKFGNGDWGVHCAAAVNVLSVGGRKQKVEIFVVLRRGVWGGFCNIIEYGVGVLGKCIIELNIQFRGFVCVVFFYSVHMSAFVCYM